MKLSSRGIDFTVFLPPYPYRGAIAITFDYESSAQSFKSSISAKARTKYREMRNRYFKGSYDLSSGYGRGYGNRIGAEIIRGIFREAEIHGTWFSTGHVILKGNKSRRAYRINQKLEYAKKETGFDFIEWRSRYSSFYHEPFGDYRTHQYYYLGDQAEELRDSGEDIQCHSFSHPFIALESPESIKTDLEDWQGAAESEGFKKSKIFAFPYLGDCYCKSKKTKGILLPSACKDSEECDTIGLSKEVLDIFRDSGFELFTRCISKEKENGLSDFGNYNNSGIGYITSKGLFSFMENEHKLTEFLEDARNKNYIADLWLHPNDILDKARFEYFKKAVNILTKEKKSGNIWIPTLSELWEKKKSLDKLSMSGEGEEFVLTNNSDNTIQDIVIRTDNPRCRIIPNARISDIGDGRYRTGINPHGRISFKIGSSI